MVQKKRAIAEIHAHDAERFLLERRLRVEHPHVHHDLARLIVDAALEFDPHPAVAFVAAVVASRHHRIGKGEERSVIAALLSEPLHVQFKLPVEHRLQPPARDVALRMPIDGVAHFHVVGRHALRDRPRRAADAEEPAHHLLPGADLRKRPVPARIEIDLQRLRMRIDEFLFHVLEGLAVPAMKGEIFVSKDCPNLFFAPRVLFRLAPVMSRLVPIQFPLFLLS